MQAELFRAPKAFAEGLGEIARSPRDGGTVAMIVVRPDRDLRELPASAELTPADGLVGDRWLRHVGRRLPDGSPDPDTQVTLMNSRVAALLAGPRERWPLAGDNLLVDLDLGDENLPIGQRLRVGDAVLEITAQPHTGCAKFSRRFGPEALAFVNSAEGRRLRLRGVNARVVAGGTVRIGDRATKLPSDPAGVPLTGGSPR